MRRRRNLDEAVNQQQEVSDENKSICDRRAGQDQKLGGKVGW